MNKVKELIIKRKIHVVIDELDKLLSSLSKPIWLLYYSALKQASDDLLKSSGCYIIQTKPKSVLFVKSNLSHYTRDYVINKYISIEDKESFIRIAIGYLQILLNTQSTAVAIHSLLDS